ncbi:helix-turn-helix domain-containing protein [Paracoccus sp. S-4012]|uniref:Crp/Fnr family transcriptional regulator n=1 Tax=Paracoccus sp. S-4012 TaxID=2665648 RepID=UPI0012B0175A|nr:Crp/Fnr family transcriptional regulator [Paracoccus sp. S-4012]MRX50467.1 helix-turn-helix domain-containing protein [Paracoccus sp. S-4012]
MQDFPIDRAYPGIFSPEDAARLAGMMGPPELCRARTRVVRSFVPLDRSLYLTRGFVGRYNLDRRGRRQFLALQIPGDYFDLSAYQLRVLDHEVDALGDAMVRPTAHADLDRLESERPDLYRKLWHISLIDASIYRYWVFRTGRLAGRARLANFLSEMFVRLYARGLCMPDGYTLPLSQNDLAEVTGMTAVHVNRLLRELRLEGVCTLAEGRVLIHNLPALIATGQYSTGYLFLAPAVERDIHELVRAGNGTRTPARAVLGGGG